MPRPAPTRRTLLSACAAALLLISLAGCGAALQPAPPPVPTLLLDASAAPFTEGAPPAAAPPSDLGEVTASGKVVPGDQASLASASGGKVTAVNVQAGDTVAAGQVLLTLAGGERLAAAVEAAGLELLSAQQAQQALNRSAALERAAAQLRLANALKSLADAQRLRAYRGYRNGSDANIESARADFMLASDAFERAQEAYNAFAGDDDRSLNKANALSALAAARKARDKALGNLNYLLAMPNELEVGQAEAELQAALAEAESAKEEYERLKDGPDPDAWALGEARIRSANAQLTAARAALADLQLTAPIAGTVAELTIHAGEWAAPGQPLLLLVDLRRLRVETTDLSELDVPRVAIGQPAQVTVKALAVQVAGRVSRIAPLAETLGGDVVYRVTVDLDTVPPGLLAGMTVEVSFQ